MDDIDYYVDTITRNVLLAILESKEIEFPISPAVLDGSKKLFIPQQYMVIDKGAILSSAIRIKLTDEGIAIAKFWSKNEYIQGVCIGLEPFSESGPIMTYKMDAPNRHSHVQDLIDYYVRIGSMRDTVFPIGPNQYGFFTNKRMFVSREEGLKIAIEARQLLKPEPTTFHLISEDLW